MTSALRAPRRLRLPAAGLPASLVLLVGLDRAAEAAVPQAKPLLMSAILRKVFGGN